MNLYASKSGICIAGKGSGHPNSLIRALTACMRFYGPYERNHCYYWSAQIQIPTYHLHRSKNFKDRFSSDPLQFYVPTWQWWIHLHCRSCCQSIFQEHGYTCKGGNSKIKCHPFSNWKESIVFLCLWTEETRETKTFFTPLQAYPSPLREISISWYLENWFRNKQTTSSFCKSVPQDKWKWNVFQVFLVLSPIQTLDIKF